MNVLFIPYIRQRGDATERELASIRRKRISGVDRDDEGFSTICNQERVEQRSIQRHELPIAAAHHTLEDLMLLDRLERRRISGVRKTNCR